MKIKNLLLGATAVAMAFASCSSDEKPEGYDYGSIVFKSSIGEQSLTRAADASWGTGDAIGIFMKKGAGLATILDGAENKKFTTSDGLGNFTPAAADQAIQYPSGGENVDFISYYPHTALTGTTYAINLKEQGSQEAIDLLYSDNAVGLSKSNSAVALNFTHQLSKVVVTVLPGAGAPAFTDLAVKLIGANTKASFDLGTKTMSGEGVKSDIVLKTTVIGTQGITEGILLPTLDASSYKLECTVAGQSYVFTFDAGTKFEAGKKNTFKVTIGDGSGNVSVLPNGSIQDWGAGSSENVELSPEGGTPPAGGAGTEASPYTVADIVAAKAGETSKWVEGYIVGSTAKTRAFGPNLDTNFLLAATPTETDESKCVIVDLIGCDIRQELNIVDYPELVGKKVSVKGNIDGNLFGKAIVLTSIVAQKGGATVTPPAEGGDPVVFYSETMGGGQVAKISTKWPSLTVYPNFDNKIVVLSGTADIRSTKSLSAHAWIAADGVKNFKIEGIPSNYKSIKLTYDITANLFSAGSTGDVNIVKVRCGGVDVVVPSFVLTKDAGFFEKYYTVEITAGIPDGMSSLEFHSDASNVLGYRIANIKLEGVAK